MPYTVDGQPTLIAGYLCTPLVKIPLAALNPGTKIVGTTIAELGNRNRPIDMMVYKKDGKEFLLMSNTDRGVMKIPTATFATETPITAPVPTGTAGREVRDGRVDDRHRAARPAGRHADHRDCQGR